ncbi:O-methyltransferase [Nonomuraea ferruginea]
MEDLVRRATERAGFAYSCDPGVGRLLAVLAAGLPARARVLEIGTGTGVGTAWLVSGLTPRTDVTVTTIERDAGRAGLARQGEWPGFVEFRTGDALEMLSALGPFDLIFADSPYGKHAAGDARPRRTREGQGRAQRGRGGTGSGGGAGHGDHGGAALARLVEHVRDAAVGAEGRGGRAPGVGAAGQRGVEDAEVHLPVEGVADLGEIHLARVAVVDDVRGAVALEQVRPAQVGEAVARGGR